MIYAKRLAIVGALVCGPLLATAPIGAADPVLVGAGDIARCGSQDDEATARLLGQIPGTIFTLGDNVYDAGTAQAFADCFDPGWGQERSRIRPAAGNHDYKDPGARGYFDYFGSAAGQAGEGYYSYDLGSWHIVVLNSNCEEVGGCGADSPQGRWLRADLAADPVACTLAYWHHPRFSSGAHGDDAAVAPFWEALYEAGADVILGGHDHDYERFDPQDPNGEPDPSHGIRAFVVGTGGAEPRGFGAVAANSEVRDSETHGVLKVTLREGTYDWEFIPADGGSFTDQGSAACVPAR